MKRLIVLLIGAVLLICGALIALEILSLSFLGLDLNTMGSRGVGFLVAISACIVFMLVPEKKTT
jgi:hypothetical protein